MGLWTVGARVLHTNNGIDHKQPPQIQSPFPVRSTREDSKHKVYPLANTEPHHL